MEELQGVSSQYYNFGEEITLIKQHCISVTYTLLNSIEKVTYNEFRKVIDGISLLPFLWLRLYFRWLTI